MSVRVVILDKQQTDRSLPDIRTMMFLGPGSLVQQVGEVLRFHAGKDFAMEIWFPDVESCETAQEDIGKAVMAGLGDFFFVRKYDGHRQMTPE